MSIAALKRELSEGEDSLRYSLLLSGSSDHAELGARVAESLLKERGYPQEKTRQVCAVIREHNKRERTTLESRILNDADILDLCGATGIARFFQRLNAFDRNAAIDEGVERLPLKSYVCNTETAQRLMDKRVEFQRRFVAQMKEELALES